MPGLYTSIGSSHWIVGWKRFILTLAKDPIIETWRIEHGKRRLLQTNRAVVVLGHGWAIKWKLFFFFSGDQTWCKCFFSGICPFFFVYEVWVRVILMTPDQSHEKHLPFTIMFITVNLQLVFCWWSLDKGGKQPPTTCGLLINIKNGVFSTFHVNRSKLAVGLIFLEHSQRFYRMFLVLKGGASQLDCLFVKKIDLNKPTSILGFLKVRF